jgi:hypothetical protein
VSLTQIAGFGFMERGRNAVRFAQVRKIAQVLRLFCGAFALILR